MELKTVISPYQISHDVQEVFGCRSDQIVNENPAKNTYLLAEVFIPLVVPYVL